MSMQKEHTAYVVNLPPGAMSVSNVFHPFQGLIRDPNQRLKWAIDGFLQSCLVGMVNNRGKA